MSDFAPDGASTITATLNFMPRYLVAGGPWESLPPIRTTDHHTYVVREVQAVIR